jgi:monolysocardiolipin acyltransferase
MWGVLPIRSFFNNRQSRWTLGARDILFTRPFGTTQPGINEISHTLHRSHAALFRNGKVIDTIRGVGIYQEAVDLAIKRLDAGEWVHVFPQGYVRQENLRPPLGRLKWGMYVSGMLFERALTDRTL